VIFFRGLSLHENPWSIQTILATGQDKLPNEEAADPSAEFGFTRGSGYYGDGDDE
jgi:hypothetical protein